MATDQPIRMEESSASRFLDKALSRVEADGHDTSKVREALAPYLSEAIDFDVAEALYWYGSDWHSGAASLGYALLCSTTIEGFRPGHVSHGPEPESVASLMYEALEAGEIRS